MDLLNPHNLHAPLGISKSDASLLQNQPERDASELNYPSVVVEGYLLVR